MVKKSLFRALVLGCCVVLLMTCFAPAVSAHEFTGKNIYEEYAEPAPKNYTWETLGKATKTHQEQKYFIIETTAGEWEEAVYVSFPAEGGFRLQTKHEYQQELEVSNVGLFEPSSLEAINYKTDSNGVLVMTGTDGTGVRYFETKDGFAIEVLNSKQTRIIYVTNEQISFGYQDDGTIVRTVVEMPMDVNKEVIYNGGNRYTTPNVIGSHFSLTNKDCFSDDDYSYGNIPFFHSNRGYSIWFNMTYPGEADFGHADETKYSVFFNGDKLDFYLWTGTPLENLKKYTDITGTSGVTEEWTFGFWTGGAADAYSNNFNTESSSNVYENMVNLLEGFKENYNFYPEACFVEGVYDAMTLQYGKSKGIRMLGWMRPYSSTEDMTALFPELTTLTPVKNADGTFKSTGWPYLYNQFMLEKTGDYMFTQPGWMDTSNPTFKEYLTRYFADAWDWGLQGIMVDFGDQLPYYGTAFNGMSAMEMHNFQTYYYGKHENEAWTERWGNDYVLFMRSVCAGSQQYTANFQGDQVHDWEGYTDIIYDMISRGAGGFNLYGGDIGGLRMLNADGSVGKNPDRDLWNRWVVMSTFSPFMRQHGTALHTPWDEDVYGYAAKANFGDYYYLRKNLVPSIMDAAIDANKTSNPMIKGMMLAYPYHLNLSQVSNQYLFCDDFLVCAVDTAMQHSLKVSLPSGNSWYNLFTNEALKGGQNIVVEAPSNFMPIYLKDGSVKPINLPDSMELMAEMHDEEDTEFSEHESLLIAPPNEERETVIYTKEGQSVDFQTYTATTEKYVSAPKDDTTFTITNAEGSRREIVVALGVTAAGVQYDGVELTRFDYMPDYYAQEYGYYVDLSGRTTIYVPAGWKELSVVKGQASYTKYEVSDNNAPKMDRMFDDNPISFFELTSGKKEWEIYLKDDAVKTIGRIEVKWTAGFLHSYNIEYTADGVNWDLLLPDGEDETTVSAGAGGIDVIEFDAVDACAIRLVRVKDGDVKSTVGIYELNVMGPDDFSEITPDGGDTDYDEFYEDEDELDDWDDEETIKTIRKKKLIYPGFPLWALILIIGGGIVVVTGVVLLIILLQRKKKKAAQEALAMAEGEAQDILEQPNGDEGTV